jgi:hypothetical protein
MVAGAAAAAFFNLLRLALVAVAAESPWSRLAELLVHQRVNIHYADLNAAGSYFAMMLLVAAGLARHRLLAAISLPLIASGLWLSGSRTAMLAAALAAAVTAVLLLRRRTGTMVKPALVLALLVVVASLAAWRLYPQGRNLEAREALSYRLELAGVALRLTAEHPVFGTGLGRFQPESAPYTDVPENAHNNFLQVMAELGLTGLVLLLLVLASALVPAWRGAGPPGPTWGLLAGVGAYLLTWLGGHPLLVGPAAYPFWLALGLAAASGAASGGLPWRLRHGGVALLMVLAIALPFRAEAARRKADIEHAGIGLSRWQREPDGFRFRWSGGRSAFFVTTAARAVRIPLRHGGRGPDTVEVRIFLDGREANRVLLERGQGWHGVRLLLGRPGERSFFRIDLEVASPGSHRPLDLDATDEGGVLMVGRPELELPPAPGGRENGDPKSKE